MGSDIKNCIQEDIRSLIISFISMESTSFQQFKSLWSERGLSMLHYSLGERRNRDAILEESYHDILSYLFTFDTIYSKVAIIYLLYLFRESEPMYDGQEHHMPIPITSSFLFKEVLECYKLFSMQKINEPLYVLRYLIINNAFSFIQSSDSSFSLQSNNNINSILYEGENTHNEVDIPDYLSKNAASIDPLPLSLEKEPFSNSFLDTSELDSFEASAALYNLLKSQLDQLSTDEKRHLGFFDPLKLTILRQLT